MSLNDAQKNCIRLIAALDTAVTPDMIGRETEISETAVSILCELFNWENQGKSLTGFGACEVGQLIDQLK